MNGKFETDALLVPNGSSGDAPTPQELVQTRSLRLRALLVLVLISLPAAVTAVCLRLLPRRSPTEKPAANKKSRYQATQLISFSINTLGGLEAHGECEGRPVDPNGVCYLGNFVLEEDVRHRLALVEEVLGRLKNEPFKEEPEVDRDPTTLKIFMMPEFFLRGPNGAYSTKQLIDSDDDTKDGLLIQVADRIRELVKDDAFEDYLFVFGTVIAATSLKDPKAPWDQEQADANDVLYYNFSPVYRGGQNHQHYYAIEKQYISGADFLSRTKLPNPSEADLHSYADASDIAVLTETFAKRNVTVVDDNIIELDGLRIGIEICLDHRMGTLWRNLQTKHKSELVDVQLITSAGMSIERGPNPIKKGGVVYLSDGEASSAACMRTDDNEFDPSHVCRAKPDGLKHIPHGGPGYTEFITLSGCIDVEKSDLLDGYYSLYQPQGCANTLKTYGIDVMDEFEYYPPSLEFYPTIDLP